MTNAIETVTINNTYLPVREYRNQRVVTFKDIDTVHERPEGTARRNFNANKSHFIEGEDFFVVKPCDIQTDEIRTSEINNRGTTLITESGYLMLAKSFTDDLAWKVQRGLVNSYFRAKDMYKAFTLLAEKVVALENRIETKTPTKPNYWLWKKHIVNPLVSAISTKVTCETRDVYDVIYDTMTDRYGFDRSFAINQMCNKYGTKEEFVIDAIADNPEYQRWFVDTANSLLNTYNQHIAPIPCPSLSSLDKVQAIIQPLAIKLQDKSVNYAQTYNKVYNRLTSKKGWKSLMTRTGCRTKKAVLLKRDDLFKRFQKCVNEMMEEI